MCPSLVEICSVTSGIKLRKKEERRRRKKERRNHSGKIQAKPLGIAMLCGIINRTS